MEWNFSTLENLVMKWEETGIGVETGLIYQGRGGGDGPHYWNKSQILIPFVILLPSPSKPPQQTLRFAPKTAVILGHAAKWKRQVHQS